MAAVGEFCSLACHEHHNLSGPVMWELTHAGTCCSLHDSHTATSRAPEGHACSVSLCTRELAIFLLDLSVSRCELSSHHFLPADCLPYLPSSHRRSGWAGEPACPEVRWCSQEPGFWLFNLEVISPNWWAWTPLHPANSLLDCSQNRGTALSSHPLSGFCFVQ